MDDKSKPQNSQPAAPPPLNHTPQNSYGSKNPVKLASGARPVLTVMLIFIAVAALVILYWVFLSDR